MFRLILTLLALCIPCTGFARECPSTVTINVISSNYRGGFTVELRKGTRPGSTLVSQRSLAGAGIAQFDSVCPGRYFFAFGTPDSDQVSLTQYFDVTNDGYSYSNPQITVTYSRSTAGGGQRVGSGKRRDL